MPKDMFYKISKEKQTMFIDVAIDEFTSKSFEKVSVNTIIKKANISRGSFYNYFSDLEELFNYILKEVKEDRINHAKTLLKKNNGDYFQFIRDLFRYDYDAFSQSGRYSLFRNYIHYIQSIKRGSLKEYLILTSIESFEIEGKSLNEIFKYEQYNLNKDDFLDLIEVLIILMINTFLKSESENLSKDEIIQLFNKRVSYLEYGLKGIISK